jgi:hypothetical protein
VFRLASESQCGLLREWQVEATLGWAALLMIAALFSLSHALDIDLGFSGELCKIVFAVARTDLIKGMC